MDENDSEWRMINHDQNGWVIVVMVNDNGYDWPGNAGHDG